MGKFKFNLNDTNTTTTTAKAENQNSNDSGRNSVNVPIWLDNLYWELDNENESEGENRPSCAQSLDFFTHLCNAVNTFDYLPLDDAISSIAREKHLDELNAVAFFYAILRAQGKDAGEQITLYDLSEYDPDFNFTDPPRLKGNHYLTPFFQAVRDNNGLPDDVPNFEEEEEGKGKGKGGGNVMRMRLHRQAFKRLGFSRRELESLLGFPVLTKAQYGKIAQYHATLAHLHQDQDKLKEIIAQSDYSERDKARLYENLPVVKMALALGIERGEGNARAKIAELESKINEMAETQKTLAEELAKKGNKGRISQANRNLFALLVCLSFNGYQNRNALFNALNEALKQNHISQQGIEYSTYSRLIDENARLPIGENRAEISPFPPKRTR